MAPVVLPPAPTDTYGATFNPQSTDDALQQRVLYAMVTLAARFPSRITTADLWHPVTCSPGYGMPPTTVWFRMVENVQCALTEKSDRWFSEKLGLLQFKVQTLVFPVGVNLDSQDEVIIHSLNDSYVVVDTVQQSGINTAKVNSAQSKFQQPPASRGTCRLLTLTASVG